MIIISWGKKMSFNKISKHLPLIAACLVIGLCVFWIVRVEIKAESLASRVDELHASLKKNQDNLDYLDLFHRGVKNNEIRMDATMLELRSYLTAMGLTDKRITMQLHDSWFFLDDKGVALSRGNNNEQMVSVTDNGIKIRVGKGNDFYIDVSTTQENITINKGDSRILVGNSTTAASGGGTSSHTGVLIGEANTGTIGVAKDKGIALKTKDKNDISIKVDDEFYVKLLPKDEHIIINKGDSKIIVGNSTTAGSGGGTSSHNGVLIGEANTGTIGIAKDQGIGLRTKDKNDISIKVDDEFYLKFLPKQDQILMKKGDSQIQIGKTSFGDGVAIGEANTATIAIANGKGLAMKAGGKNEVRISGEDKLFIQFEGEVNIKAEGDVNIKSEKGNVNLKGKRINLNE